MTEASPGLFLAKSGGGCISLFVGEPRYSHGQWFSVGDGYHVECLPKGMFPDLKPGECRQLVLAEPEKVMPYPPEGYHLVTDGLLQGGDKICNGGEWYGIIESRGWRVSDFKAVARKPAE